MPKPLQVEVLDRNGHLIKVERALEQRVSTVLAKVLVILSLVLVFTLAITVTVTIIFIFCMYAGVVFVGHLLQKKVQGASKK